MQIYFNASDACVLPYRRVTTSGAALLAYSFGKPIVAPAIGPFPDLITPERGVLFHPDKGDLTDALCRVRELDAAQASAAALDFAPPAIGLRSAHNMLQSIANLKGDG